MESVGACVLANDNPFTGQAGDIFQRRLNGESWANIAKAYDLGSPNAARQLFKKLTGISDFKIKGPELLKLAKGGVPTPPKVIKPKKLGDPKPTVDMEKLVIGDIPAKPGVPPAAYNNIKTFNKDGLGYLKISNLTGQPIDVVDDVLHHAFMTKHKGNVWEAFKEKPQSQAGLDALKKSIFDARKKGLEVDEIVKHMGIDKDVVEGILKGTYKPPAPGAGNVFKKPVAKPAAPKMSQPKKPPAGHQTPTQKVEGETLEPDFKTYPKATVSKLNGLYDPTTLPTRIQQAVRSYTGSTYREINRALRGSEKMTDGVQGLVDRMDKAFQPTTVNMAVTRGMDRQGFGLGNITDEQIDNLAGKVISDAGYLSTSVKPVFSQEIRLNLEVPAGAKGVWAKPLSMHASEDEFILARGTKIMVTGVQANKKQYGTTWTVIGRVIV